MWLPLLLRDNFGAGGSVDKLQVELRVVGAQGKSPCPLHERDLWHSQVSGTAAGLLPQDWGRRNQTLVCLDCDGIKTMGLGSLLRGTSSSSFCSCTINNLLYGRRVSWTLLWEAWGKTGEEACSECVPGGTVRSPVGTSCSQSCCWEGAWVP